MHSGESQTLTLFSAALVAIGCAIGSGSDDATFVYSTGAADSGAAASTGTGGFASPSGSGGSVQGDGATSSGGTGSGGAAGEAPGGSGGTSGSSGSGSGGSGSSGSGGTSTGGNGGTSCPAGQKLCGGLCVAPKPALGCTLLGCDPCPTPPSFGSSVCVGDACDFECFTGYAKSGSTCVSSSGGSGGAGGSGAGGTSGTGGTSGGGMQCFHCSGTCAGLNSDSACFVDCVGNQGRPGCIWSAGTCTCT
jgi:hypothetical protein